MTDTPAPTEFTATITGSKRHGYRWTVERSDRSGDMATVGDSALTLRGAVRAARREIETVTASSPVVAQWTVTA